MKESLPLTVFDDLFDLVALSRSEVTARNRCLHQKRKFLRQLHRRILGVNIFEQKRKKGKKGKKRK